MSYRRESPRARLRRISLSLMEPTAIVYMMRWHWLFGKKGCTRSRTVTFFVNTYPTVAAQERTDRTHSEGTPSDERGLLVLEIHA